MPPITNQPDLQFSDNLPLIEELPADLETPVSVYMKLAGDEPAFLLESITGGENLARYSFIGVNPRGAVLIRGDEVHIRQNGDTQIKKINGENPLKFLREEIPGFGQVPIQNGLPRFSGGLVGYLGYEMMRFFETNIPLETHPELPDALFLLADTVVAFDHAFGKLILIARYRPAPNEETAQAEAKQRLSSLRKKLDQALPQQNFPAEPEATAEFTSNHSRANFENMVAEAKEYIKAGDIFQIVLSQRLTRETPANAFSIYRALRSLNPSPYMFFFDFGSFAGEQGLQLIGASPELHVRLEHKQASLRPIAGTRPRGKDLEKDLNLEKELLADPKERAEHVMLVDLARNDLGRVCRYGTVSVPEQMVIERYSHVMHIVSHVSGELNPELDSFDLMQATFPAGTVSGAPKIRAMQLIHTLEKNPRGVYAGAVGYFANDGSMDTCIAIRTIVKRGSKINIQAGAGIVADSDPLTEYQESLNKARALAVAVEMAETNPNFSRPLSQTGESL